MTSTVPTRLGFKELVPVISSLIAAAFIVGGALRADGGRDKQIDDNTRRIETLERADVAKTDLLTKIDGRTIRIETKLEIMAPAKSGEVR